jgi:hypothetical protein
LEVRERSPSTLENVDGGPPGRRCRSWRSESATINAVKTSMAGPLEAMPELEIRERQPSTLENIDDNPPARRCRS